MSENHTPTVPNYDRAITVAISAVLGILAALVAVAFTDWSGTWMLLGTLAGGVVGAGIGYWTSLSSH